MVATWRLFGGANCNAGKNVMAVADPTWPARGDTTGGVPRSVAVPKILALSTM